MSNTEEKSNKPSYYVKVRRDTGENATFEQIGAAWQNDKGAIFVKLAGKQIVDEPFTLYPASKSENGDS